MRHRVSLTLLALLPLLAGSAQAATRELAPGGNVQTFMDTLQPGDVGCLHAGSYTADTLRANRAGSSSAPITLTSCADGRATVTLRYLYVPRGMTDWRFDALNVVGTAQAGITLQLNGDRGQLTGSDVTNNHQAESCINLGYQPIIDPVVSGNHIHGCGKTADGNHDHGIYVEGTTRASIAGNVIEDSYGGWGIQLWPAAVNTVIEGNTVRASSLATEGGVVISAGSKSHGNVIRNNVLVGNGKNYIFDDYQLPSDGATASGNCVVAHGSSLWEGAVRDGGGNHVEASEADCGITPPPPPPPVAQCADSVDNDADGLIDLADPGCTDAADNDETDSPPPPPPSTGPSVSITNPADGLVTTASYVCATVSVSDDKGVTKVTWILDGNSSTERTYTSPPFSYTCWGITVGQHTIKATATDTDGNVSFDANTWTRR